MPERIRAFYAAYKEQKRTTCWWCGHPLADSLGEPRPISGGRWLHAECVDDEWASWQW